MRFLRPDMAGWLLAVPIVAACWFAHVFYKRAVRAASAIVPGRTGLSRMSTWRLDVVVLVLWTAAAVALVVAMMRPQVPVRTRHPVLDRQDLVLVLDRSASMHAADVRPSRFLRAVREIEMFLRHKPDAVERVGLVGFAHSSVVLSYLTRDVDNLIFFLEWISEAAEPIYGTDLAAALAMALDVGRKDDSRNEKIYVVLSDGEDRSPELAWRLEELRRDGTRIHAIGTGSDDEVPIPFAPANGPRVLLRDDGGRIMTTRFDESTLRRIADVTGGRYYRSTAGGELSAAMADIVRHEQRVIGWTTAEAYRDLYPLALAVAGASLTALLLVL